MDSFFHVFVIVLLSKTCSVCTDATTLTQDDANLEKTSASSILGCAVDCFSNTGCLSFGFEPAIRGCQLHVQNNAAATRKMKGKKNWLHSNIDLWTKKLLGPCYNHTCKRGHRCAAATFVKAKVSLSSEYCPVPAVIPNANISSGNQQAESVRTYTCKHGYLDTSLDSTTGFATCMGDGEWSKVQLNCSGPYLRMETPSTPDTIFTPIPTETLRAITGEKSNLIFLGRTCNDLNFKLSVYVVIIGGWANTQSVIRTFSPAKLKTVHRERGVVSCEEFRPFWLSWENGTISVGKGSMPGDDMFMEWTPQLFTPVKSVGISSYKHNTGTWLFIPRI